MMHSPAIQWSIQDLWTICLFSHRTAPWCSNFQNFSFACIPLRSSIGDAGVIRFASHQVSHERYGYWLRLIRSGRSENYLAGRGTCPHFLNSIACKSLVVFTTNRIRTREVYHWFEPVPISDMPEIDSFPCADEGSYSCHASCGKASVTSMFQMSSSFL